MQYKQADTFSNTLHICLRKSIWKYNALYHLITEHSNDDMVPKIPGELLVNFFMHKKEENALGVREDSTKKWRKENNIPDSDGLALMMEDQQKRGISDTVSTTLSDSHDKKRAKLIGIPK